MTPPRAPPRQDAERRADARFDAGIPARIRVSDGRSFLAIVRNISRSGVLVHLDAAHIAALLPNVTRELPHIPVEVRLELRLPGAGAEPPTVIECGIAHLGRIASDQAAMGLAFRRFDAGSAEALARICGFQQPVGLGDIPRRGGGRRSLKSLECALFRAAIGSPASS